MNISRQDTRNRWQQIYDSTYDDKIYNATQLSDLISETEFREIVRRNGNTALEKQEKQLIRNGFIYRHPRTQELIIGHYKSTHAELRLVKKLQPCVPYARRRNAKQPSLRFKSSNTLKCFVSNAGKNKTDKRIKVVQVGIYESTKQFKTVWYSRHDRRK